MLSAGSVTSLKPCDSSPADKNWVNLRQRLTVSVNPSRPKDSNTAQVAATEAPLLVPTKVYCASSVKYGVSVLMCDKQVMSLKVDLGSLT